MRFFEYEAREIVKRAGIPVTDYGFATTPQEAREIAVRIGGPVVIKSQVLTGGRMKAGGVQFADTPDEAERHARHVLALEINGHMPRGVLVDSRAEVKQEYYAGVVWDGIRKQPVMLFSDMGGIDIEEVAEKHPDHVGRAHFSTLLPFSDYMAKEVVAQVGVTGSRLSRITRVLARLAQLFLDYDMTLAEVNPLGELEDGKFVALDAHMDMENEARPRQNALLAELGVGAEETRQAREPTEFELAGEVTPGRKGRDVHGVPVFDSVEQAVEHHGGPIDGSVVTVPPAFTKDAVLEAIAHGVKLVVIVTERIPRRDVAEMVEFAKLHDARIIGPNCLGIMVPGVIKMGGIGGPARDAEKAYSPGPVGVMSRSGGMTTEISSTLTAADLGQSTAVSIGGGALLRAPHPELMPLFEADEQTEGIVIYTEPGGRMEAELARWVTEHDSRLPIVAFMAGRFMDEMPGMSFGHAGTIVEGKADTAAEKIARLGEAGIAGAGEGAGIPPMGHE